MHAKKTYHAILVAVLALLGLELVTGVAVIFPYKASVPAAYTSSKSMESSGFLGLIQSAHHWGSALLIVLGGLAIVFGLVSGAYRLTTKKLWISGILLVILFLLLQLTGHLLPWDQHAVRTAVVEAGIGEGTPLLGKQIGSLIRSGPSVGAATLSFWYLAHVAIFTVVNLALAVFVGLKLRKLEIDRRTAWIASGSAVIAALLAAILQMPHLGPVATAGDSASYIAKPEWYILPMHELLDFVTGINPSMGFIGTMVIPGIAILLVALAPWIGTGKPGKKPIYGIALGCLLVFGVGILSLIGAKDMAKPAGPNIYVVGTYSKGPSVKLDADLVAMGKKLVNQQGCLNCHSIGNQGSGNGGPDLVGTASRHPDLQWQIDHLSNPKSMSPGSTMPAFSKIGQGNLKAIGEYLETLK